jgi:hypothetical protein
MTRGQVRCRRGGLRFQLAVMLALTEDAFLAFRAKTPDGREDNATTNVLSSA